MSVPQDRYIRVGQVNTRYWAEGTHGAPVVFIHGIRGSVESWLPTFGALAAHHRVYALDLPGHGRADKPLRVSYKIADLARFVRDFLAALRIERAHVVGHSFGGAVVTRLAILFPANVDRLVLVASAGLGKRVTRLLQVCSLPLVGRFFARPTHSRRSVKWIVHDPAVMTDELLEQNYQLASLPDATQAFIRALRHNGYWWTGRQRGSTYGPNVRGLATIANPVLVIWGRQDRVLPVAHAEVATKGLRNVRAEIFEDCGHIPMLEHPQRFNRMLLEFLGS